MRATPTIAIDTGGGVCCVYPFSAALDLDTFGRDDRRRIARRLRAAGTELKPGSCVVVQAPPWGGGLQIICSYGGMQQQTQRAGEDVTCRFIGLP